MKVRKKLMLFTGVLGATVLLTACGNDSATNADEAGGGTIRYALWDAVQAPVFEELAAKFYEETGVTVNFELTPWAQYWTNLETAITGQNAPDVFWMNIPRAPDYIENGVLLPLDNLNIAEGSIPQNFLDAFSSEEGVVYGIPKDFDSVALYFNTTMFDEAGLGFPDYTWTWEDFKDAARTLTEELDGVHGFAAPVAWQGGYYEAILQNGGTPFINDGAESGFGEPAAIEALEWWYSFHEEGLSPSIQILAETTPGQLLLNGQVAMIFQGSWHMRTTFENPFGYEHIDIAPMPKGVRRATTSNSLAHVVSAHSQNPEAAKQWIEFLSTKENSQFVAEAGVAIPIVEGSAEAWTNAFPSKNLQVHIDALEYSFTLPNYKNSMGAIAIEQEILNSAWVGDMTVREAALEIQQQANSILGN